MILTTLQLKNLATLAGFPASEVLTAVAIALAESNGNTKAYNPEIAAAAPPLQGSYGLFQIFLHKHPEFDMNELCDPLTNTFAAFDIWKKAGGSFEPWSTFTGGAYKRFLEIAGAV